MKHLYLILFPVLACVATAQTSDGINAPVSRTVTLTADEAAFTITAGATLESTQQQVKQALQNAGLPNPTVVATGLGQDSSPRGAAQIIYSATVVIPASSAIDTAKSMETLRTHLTDPLQSLQYSVAFNPSQSKIDAMSQVVTPQLLDDARKLAQSLAAGAGVKLGGIRSISDSAGAYVFAGSLGPVTSVLDPTTVSRIGGFLLGAPYSLSAGTLYTFSLNVVFGTVQ